jgi:hypothetical protein
VHLHCSTISTFPRETTANSQLPNNSALQCSEGTFLELKNEDPTFELYFAALWQSLQKWIPNRLKPTSKNSIKTLCVLPRSTSHQCHLDVPLNLPFHWVTLDLTISARRTGNPARIFLK